MSGANYDMEQTMKYDILELIRRVDTKWAKEEDEEKLNNLLIKCPQCKNYSLVVCRSVCQDQGCCGIPNAIRCVECNWNREEFGDLEDFVLEYI